MARVDSRGGGYLENSLENFQKYPPPRIGSREPPLREFCPKMTGFTGNSAISFAIFGNFTLVIDYLGLNKLNKPETSLQDYLISEKTALPVAIFGRHLASKYPPPPRIFRKIRHFTLP